MNARWPGCVLFLSICVGTLRPDSGSEILEATGIKGGVVVHIGCGDSELTQKLQPNDRYLVQGVDVDRQNVAKARAAALAADGEIMRVLVPSGVPT